MTEQLELNLADLGESAETFDVCVVGTGAGGGVLAYRLAKAGLRVLSLEQGPLLGADQFKTIMPPGLGTTFGVGPETVWPTDPHDSLFIHPLFARADTGSTPREPGQFNHYQIHAVSGLQNLWNGVSVRFSGKDLQGWPIQGGELDAHYSDVERLVTVCGHRDGLSDLPDGEFIEPKPFRPADELIIKAVKALGDGYSHAIANRKAINTRPGMSSSCVSTGICTSGCPVGSVYKFSARLLPEIESLPNYELRGNAKVMRLIRDGNTQRIGAVEYLDTATGQTHLVRAATVVLATGAVETPRILFNSADDKDPNGLGNHHDQLGRGLQDNPKVVLSTSLYKLWGSRLDYDIGYGDLLILMSREKLPDGSEFPFIGHAIHGIPDYPHYLGQMALIPPAIKEKLARHLFYSYVTLGLFCAGERLSENRVKPGHSHDRYGVRQVDIDFSTTQNTHEQMDAMMRWGTRVLKKASCTRIYKTRDCSGTGIHYAGTTAMANDETRGVVDANLKVFGYENLYVCDGGVIPLLPDKHLTLTIMALSNRLASHLEAKHARRKDRLQTV
ncbi:GMC oxidoreductase [Orrella marina]|uniref:GMC oxidoreductase n=1 Tax=Orrella marina TaxID=2163011 RepID=UPI001D130BD0|nr:GMC family oxidoreductase [Orrella marina]